MAEFLLPVALKLFPNMLPSTFTSAKEREAKMQRKLKARIEMAEFVKETAQYIHETAKLEGNFESLFQDMKTGQVVSSDQVYKFVKMFKDDVTLDSLQRNQIQAMCRFLDIRPFGPTQLLRFQLRNKINALKRDDKMIRSEGLQNLTLVELKQACAARGMSSIGTRQTLEALMNEWFDLALNRKIPTTLLILSRAFRLMPHQSTEELLMESVQHMPESVIDEIKTETSLASHDRKECYFNCIHNYCEAKLEALKEERKKIVEENEKQKQKQKESTKLLAGSVEELSDEEEKVRKIGKVVAQKATPYEEEKEQVDDMTERMIELRDEETAEKIEKTIEKKLEKMIVSIEKEVQKAELGSVRMIDTDYDGRVTTWELQNALSSVGFSEQETKDMIARLDTDSDGYVDLVFVKKLQKFDVDFESLAANAEDEDLKKRAEALKIRIKQEFERKTPIKLGQPETLKTLPQQLHNRRRRRKEKSSNEI